jgi:hypothetical protein
MTGKTIFFILQVALVICIFIVWYFRLLTHLPDEAYLFLSVLAVGYLMVCGITGFALALHWLEKSINGEVGGKDKDWEVSSITKISPVDSEALVEKTSQEVVPPLDFSTNRIDGLVDAINGDELTLRKGKKRINIFSRLMGLQISFLNYCMAPGYLLRQFLLLATKEKGELIDFNRFITIKDGSRGEIIANIKEKSLLETPEFKDMLSRTYRSSAILLPLALIINVATSFASEADKGKFVLLAMVLTQSALPFPLEYQLLDLKRGTEDPDGKWIDLLLFLLGVLGKWGPIPIYIIVFLFHGFWGGE